MPLQDLKIIRKSRRISHPQPTLDSGIDLGQGINEGHGKFGKNLGSFVKFRFSKKAFSECPNFNEKTRENYFSDF